MAIFSLQNKIQYQLMELLTLKAKRKGNSGLSSKSIVVEISSQTSANQIVYKSPLCWQIAQIEGEKPSTLAQEIVNLWTNQQRQSELDIQVQISGYGWLEFILGDRLLVNWLQKLPQIKFPPQPLSDGEKELNFQLYYAHARCCSLLRSAHRDKLIQLKSLDFSQCRWLWHQPEVIPYDCGCLKLDYEVKLLYQLTIIVDAIYDQKKSNWLKLASDFKDAILDFERYCRIFGEKSGKNRQLSQSRLGLIALAQFYFQWILIKKLGAIAPMTL